MSLTISSKSVTVVTLRHPGGKPHGAMSARLESTGGVEPVTWQRTSGKMPDGVELTSNGTLRGTPTQVGQSLIFVRATDSATPANFDDAPITVVVR